MKEKKREKYRDRERETESEKRIIIQQKKKKEKKKIFVPEYTPALVVIIIFSHTLWLGFRQEPRGNPIISSAARARSTPKSNSIFIRNNTIANNANVRNAKNITITASTEIH